MKRTTAGTIVAALFAMTAIFAPSATADTVKAVEYFHPASEHYFVTPNPAEIAALDSGAVKGWSRTGQRYRVDDAPAADLAPVCRFYTAAFAGKPTHFFTASAAECELLKGNPDWTYEGVAFYARVPDAQRNCAVGTAAIHRLYNAGRGGAPNHAYTSDIAKLVVLTGAGWVSEGVAFCVPLATPVAVDQVLALVNSLWDIPPRPDAEIYYGSGRVFISFRPFSTENYEFAAQTFQNYQIPIPAALIAHDDLIGSGLALYNGGGWTVAGDFLGEGGAGWDQLAGEYVFLSAEYYNTNEYAGAMWTFDDAQGPERSVCTMGVSRIFAANGVGAVTPHEFQPFVLSGCKAGVAKKVYLKP